jgi:hypothetical protein
MLNCRRKVFNHILIRRKFVVSIRARISCSGQAIARATVRVLLLETVYFDPLFAVG